MERDPGMTSAWQLGKRAWPWLAGAAVVGWLIWKFPPFHVIPLETGRQRQTTGRFDAEAFVERFWNEQLLPSESRALEVTVLLAGLRDHPGETMRRHGHRLGVSLTTGFLVRGRGVVVEATGEAVGLALEPGGPVAVVIELGPVFGNTLRDGCGLLDVNEFPDSRDFNAISAALNRRVEERVLPGLRARAAPGTVVEFAGCVDITDPVRDTAPLRVVPFKVTFP
jgi:predicted lipoprotein